MPFQITEAKETRIVVTGRLDTVSAPALMEILDGLRGKDIERIVFVCHELTYLSSAGIRAIIFAKQKIGDGVDILMEGANSSIKDVLVMVGLDGYIEFIE